MVHEKRREEEGLCPTCISTPVAGKSPSLRPEFSGKGCHCQHGSTGLGAGRCWHRSCLLWSSSAGRADDNPA